MDPQPGDRIYGPGGDRAHIVETVEVHDTALRVHTKCGRTHSMPPWQGDDAFVDSLEDCGSCQSR